MSVDLNSVGSRGCLQKMPGTELCLCDKPRWSQAKDSLQIAHSAPGSESTKGSCSSRQTSEPTEELACVRVCDLKPRVARLLELHRSCDNHIHDLTTPLAGQSGFKHGRPHGRPSRGNMVSDVRHCLQLVFDLLQLVLQHEGMRPCRLYL